MTEKGSALQRGRRYGDKRAAEIWENLGKNNLWKRILKNVTATTLLVSICLIPGSRTVIGKAAYLGAITTVFGHPGRRFGQMAEALILVLSGTVLGVAWSVLGVYLGSLVIKEHPPAAYAIRAIFLAVVVLFHGYLRSKTPRLFIFVLLLVIVSVVSLTSTAKVVTPLSATNILYPILIAAGCITLVNICIFPEFSSRYLGQMTLDTLNDTVKALGDAGIYFVESKRAVDQNGVKTGEKRADASMTGPAWNATDEERGLPQKKVTNLTNAPMHIKAKDILQRLFASKSQGTDHSDPKKLPKTSLADLTSNKAKIRKKLSDCKAAQQECNFELAVSVLPPRNMKPISVQAMKKLVANTIAVISACESKFALLGSDDVGQASNSKKTKPGPELVDESKTPAISALVGATSNLLTPELPLPHENPKLGKLNTIIEQDKAELEMIKPKREIEFGDARLLRYLLARVAKPYEDLHFVVARTVEVVSACVAYAYDVPTLPSGARVPKGILLEELDMQMDSLQKALLQFDADAASALEGAATLQELEGKELDIMPREEVFLMSSFMLNVRQAASHIESMLKHSRELVGRRQQRNGRRRIYAPHIKWSNWLYTGGEEDEALPNSGRKGNRQGASDEREDDEDDAESLNSKKGLLAHPGDLEKNALTPEVKEDAKQRERESRARDFERQEIPYSLRLRGQAADALEWIQHSEDLLYAMKLGVAVFLVLWPAFVASWNTWYSLDRGLWAALQLVLITEVSIGTSVWTFVLRGVGTTIGCIWGWAAVEARGGNPVVCAALIFVALFPCAYVQLGTKYPKAGMVCIVSICVVALSSELNTVPGTPTDNFLKRWIAFMIGGTVALIVELVLLPVKARTRLVESLAAALEQINEMEKCIAAGIEQGVKIDVYAAANIVRFENANGKANTALVAAETFLPFCSNEPRIKGSFEGLALIYTEVLFVLHQIVDRMDNMLQLRTAYGSGPLEELNAEIYPYRRNVAGSITLTLFAIHGALTTKLPLPQYIPSARLAHLRMINRVREVVLEQVAGEGHDSHEITAKLARQRAVRRKYMSWNAASAAQAEIIEFLEELIDLTKLLVGANEFRSGLLTRPTYHDYVQKSQKQGAGDDGDEVVAAEARDEFGETPLDTAGATTRTRGTTLASVDAGAGLTRRRQGTTLSSTSDGEDVPASLRRIQSRKLEAGVLRQRTNESWKSPHQGT
ncbi:hypothetical protein HO133_010964 [Letharia lupina]|uniref:ER transporter 6TM N-terminal domain-containing protein n=1 Tax=Letharia lupina TaxID=560253 RepID=A0A8H6CJ05_9LECA|nr:uncharacterized protein HO133_010964 [Letharia lupina]KAF6224387.1 hypothetical protein HO133_010964 [Letharia lupina]